MLQRIQTLYLCGALIVNGLFLFLPLETSKDTTVSLTSNIILTVLNVSLNGILLFNIFSFRNRKLQMLICKWLVLLFLAEVGLSILFVTLGSLHWNLSLPFVSIVFTLLALRGVKHDDQLVRSADRLR